MTAPATGSTYPAIDSRICQSLRPVAGFTGLDIVTVRSPSPGGSKMAVPETLCRNAPVMATSKRPSGPTGSVDPHAASATSSPAQSGTAPRETRCAAGFNAA